MSREIDERVVQMQFDNAQFESGVKTSLGTLDKLKGSLDFGDSVESIENLQNTGRRFDLSGMGNAVDFVTGKFSAFEIMAVRTLSNIADSAYRTGTRLIKSLSVDQISAGWGKYGEKTNAVSSLISQGKWSMEEIDAQLERLNWFTDETSYNFTDMTKEIGKFTAAGKGLDESVNAMEGIAMWAALSGQNAGTASRAMYQISQAMGAGVMRKEDYKSIQNAAMDTEEFRQKALDAGVAAKTLKKNADGTYTSIVKGAKSATFSISQFADNLTQTQWFNDEVMMNVFGQYGAAVDQIYAYAKEHNVTASEAIEALGDKVDAFGLKAFRSAQEARTFSDVIDSVKDAVSTGWMNSFEYIFGNYEEAKELWTDLANEMYDVFAGGAEARNDMLALWKEKGGRDALINSFWNSWNSMLDILNLVKEAFHNIFPEMDAERLLDITKKIENFTVAVKDFLNPKEAKHSELLKKGLVPEEMTKGMETAERVMEAASHRMDNLSKSLKGVFAILDIGKQALGAIFEIFKRVIAAAIPGFDFFLESTGSIGDWLVNLANSAREMDFFGQIVESVTPIINTFGDALRWVFEHISNGVKKITGLFKPVATEISEAGDTITKKVNPIASAIDFVVAVVKKLGSVVKAVWNGGLGDILGSLGTSIANLFSKLREGLEKEGGLKNFADILTGGLFAGGLLTKNLLQGRLSKLIKTILGISSGSGIEKVQEALSTFIDSMLDKFLNVQEADIGTTMIKFAGALGILALSIFVLSAIDPERMVSVVMAIAALALIFVKVRKSLLTNVRSGGGIGDVITNFVDQTLQAFSPKKHGQMLQLIELGAVLVLFASAIGVLAKAVATIGTLGVPQLVVGLVGVAALLGMMLVVAKQLSKFKGKIEIGVGALYSMGTAVEILARSVKTLGEMPLGQLIAGTVAVGVLVGAVTVFAKFAGKVSMGTGIALIGLATGILIMSAAIKVLAKINPESLGVSVFAISALLGVIGLFANLVDWKKMLGASASMILMSVAITIISGALKLLSTIKMDALFAAVGAISVLMVVIGMVTQLLTGTIGGAASFVILSVGIALLAGSLALLSLIPMDRMKSAILGLAAGLAVLVIGANLLAPACASIGFGMLGIALALAAITAAIAMLDTITVMSQASIFNGIKKIAEGILDVLTDLGPKLVVTGLNLLYNLLDGFVANFPIIIEKGIALVTTLVAGITEAMPVLVQAAFDLTVSFINAVADGIEENSDAIWSALKHLFGEIVKFILDGIDSLLGWIPGVSGALEDAKKWVDDNFSPEDTKETTKEVMSGTKEGIEEATPEAKEAMEKYYHEIFKEDGSIDFERAKEIAAENGIDLASILPGTAQKEAKKHEGEMSDILTGQYDEYVKTLKEKNAEAEPMAKEEFEEYQSYIADAFRNGKSKEEIREEIGTFYYDAIEGPLVEAGTDASEAAETAAAAIPENIRTAVAPDQSDKDALYYDYFTYGSNASEGFYQGATAKIGQLKGIAGIIKDAVGTETAKKMEEKSPSKLMFRIGAYAIQGMLNGMTSLKDALFKTSSETTDGAIEPIKEGFGSLQNLIDEGLEADPTIRPVLDLSEIQNGMSIVDGMFGNRSIQVGSIHSNGRIISDQMGSISDKLQEMDDRLSSVEENRVYKFDIHTEIDGRQVARSTAVYNKEELDRLTKLADRKVGAL